MSKYRTINSEVLVYDDDIMPYSLKAIVKSVDTGNIYYISRGETVNNSLASIGSYYKIKDEYKDRIVQHINDYSWDCCSDHLHGANPIDYYGSPSREYRDNFVNGSEVGIE